MKKTKLLLLMLFYSGFSTFAQVGINTENPQGVFNVDGGKNNAVTGTPTAIQQKDDVVVTASGQVGIGNTLPNNYAMLDISSDDKGILIPQVNLTSSNMDLNSDGDNNISNQPHGLLIYNKGTALARGYYFWNGTEWRTIDNSSSTEAVTTINCSSAVLDPSQKIDGDLPTPIISGTVLKIHYSGANGGRYNGITLTSVGNPNITATITSGKLESGSGNLVFTIQGTPSASQSSPAGISFDLAPFIAANPGFTGCSSVTVGTQVYADVQTRAVMDYMKFVTDPDTGVKGFSVDAKTPDGLYTIKVFMRHSLQTAAATAHNNTTPTTSGTENNVLIRNNTSANKVLMWNYSTFYGGQITDAGGNLNIPAGIPGGGTGNTWRSLSTATAGTGAWGNQGIYNANSNGPEYRYYSWIDTSNTSKVAYIVTVMAGMDPSASNTEVIKQKVFIRIEQITGV
nr:hypothetical protein [uncultured Chryseobacterium sp.]